MSKELANKIRIAGWWQGSVADTATLTSVVPSLPQAPTHWVMASQTCNLYNENFEKISKIEWISARALLESERSAPLRGGRNPRQLETMATSGSGDFWVLCDSQERQWTSRACLTTITPCAALKDTTSADPNERHKDIFARWLARGYIRLELSDELGAALKKGKFAQAIDSLVKTHEKSIFGIFIKLDSHKEDQEREEQERPEMIQPPCGIDMTIVVRNEADLAEVKEKLTELFDNLIVPTSSTGKISRVTALKTEVGIHLVHTVVPASRWTVNDIESSIRYNFNDYLSGSDEADRE